MSTILLGGDDDRHQKVCGCLSDVPASQIFNTVTRGLLQPLPIPTEVWEDISLDFIEGLPKSEGVNSILVVVDRLTKYGHFISLKHPYTAVDVAMVFVQVVVRLHGFPKTIVSDRDRIFTGQFWKELFRLSGTGLCFSTAYHPQSDGQTKVTNRGLETYLRCFAGDKPRTWAKFLQWAEFSNNTSFHSAIQMSPFQALYGREPPSLVRFENGSTNNAELETRLRERDDNLALLRQQLLKAQQTMKARADSHRREVEFQVGDKVFLKIRPYRQKSLARRVNEKLSARFYGPYEVAARVGKVAYRLHLPSEARIHPTFHVSQLKKVVGEAIEPATIPPQLSEEGILEAAPEAVLAHRVNRTTGHEELLIKWAGLPEADCTWEWKSVIKKQFPELDLEDKVSLNGGGNVTYEAIRPPILYRYKRRSPKTGPSEEENLESVDEEGHVRGVHVREYGKGEEAA